MGGKNGWENDQAVAEWLLDQYKEESANQQIKDHLKLMKTESMMSQFRTLVRNMSEDEFMEAGILVAQKLSQTKREEFIQAFGQIRSEEDDENSKVEQESKDLDHDKDDSSASENGF